LKILIEGLKTEILENVVQGHVGEKENLRFLDDLKVKKEFWLAKKKRKVFEGNCKVFGLVKIELCRF
jgi:hypothetical protein